MKILFVHQNMPGQYRELLQWLAARPDHEVVFLTQRNDPPQVAGVTTAVYAPHQPPGQDAYGLSRVWHAAVSSGFGAIMAAQKIESEHGFRPDIILGHTGWGELLFFKQLWPDIPQIGFFEYFYNMTGGLIGFDPAEQVFPETAFIMEARNAVPYASIQRVDVGHVPTRWQNDLFPQSFHDKLYVCHDGIRTDRLRPNPNASLGLNRIDKDLTRDDEIITYLARNLEHARGFHIFMRALPRILKERPNARVIIVGGDSVSYGQKSKHPQGLRGQMQDELQDSIDWDRVHFLGLVPYSVYMQIVQISRCHIYMTMPFVMSWSLLEAMSMEATIVATDVPSVREAVTHGETGLLVDFFDHDALAEQVISVVSDPAGHAHLGPAARAHVLEKYDFLTRCLPEHVRQINALVPPEKHITLD